LSAVSVLAALIYSNAKREDSRRSIRKRAPGKRIKPKKIGVNPLYPRSIEGWFITNADYNFTCKQMRTAPVGGVFFSWGIKQ
jgi:hypothetical protein